MKFQACWNQERYTQIRQSRKKSHRSMAPCKVKWCCKKWQRSRQQERKQMQKRRKLHSKRKEFRISFEYVRKLAIVRVSELWNHTSSVLSVLTWWRLSVQRRSAGTRMVQSQLWFCQILLPCLGHFQSSMARRPGMKMISAVTSVVFGHWVRLGFWF